MGVKICHPLQYKATGKISHNVNDLKSKHISL